MASVESIAAVLLLAVVVWRSIYYVRRWRAGERNPRSLLFLGMLWVLWIGLARELMMTMT